jgi:hypothetical protein
LRIIGGIIALEEYWVRNARDGGIFEESSPWGDIAEYLRGPRNGGGLGEECSHWRNIRGILAFEEYWGNLRNGGILHESSPWGYLGILEGSSQRRKIEEYWKNPRAGGRLRNIGGTPALGEDWVRNPRIGGIFGESSQWGKIEDYWSDPRIGGILGESSPQVDIGEYRRDLALGKIGGIL